MTASAALAGSGATGSSSSRSGPGTRPDSASPLTSVLLNARCRIGWRRNRPPQEHLRQIQQKGRNHETTSDECSATSGPGGSHHG